MAVKTKNKVERAARRAREDKVYSLILSAFGICILLELILISLYRVFYTSDAYGLEFYLGRLWWLGLIPAAGCVLLLVLKKDSRKLRSLAAWGLVFFLIAAVSALLMGTWRHLGAKACCIALPVLTVLYCVYLIYQREFFMTALSFAVAIVTLWAFRRTPAGLSGGALLGALALILVFCVWSAVSCRLGGRLWKKGPQFFPKKAEWPVLFAAYGLCLCSLAGALLFGAGFAYAAIFALAGLVFVAAVYYTVKLL